MVVAKELRYKAQSEVPVTDDTQVKTVKKWRVGINAVTHYVH